MSDHKGCLCNELTLHRAARGGHLEVLVWAKESGRFYPRWICSGAAAGGHLEVLSGQGGVDVRGARTHVGTQRWEATSRCSSGERQWVSLGTGEPAG